MGVDFSAIKWSFFIAKTNFSKVRVRVMVFNAIFNNISATLCISWWSVLFFFKLQRKIMSFYSTKAYTTAVTKLIITLENATLKFLFITLIISH